MADRCANCRADLTHARETGTSSLYSPDQKFELCVSCFWGEEALIEAAGTNNLPDWLERYKRNARDFPNA